MNEQTFDVLVIGSSPLLLIEALVLEREGRRVSVAEASREFGGAWSTRRLWEFDNVEARCHYIDRGRRGYAFLRETLGLELEPQAVESIWFNTDGPRGGERSIGALGRWALRKLLWGRLLPDELWRIIKSFRKRDPLELGRALRGLLLRQPYLYPAAGSRDVVDALIRRIRTTSVQLLNDSRVEDVVLGSNGCPSRFVINGQPACARTLVLGQHVYPRLRLAGMPRSEDEDLHEINVLLRISGRKARPFDYIEVRRNELVNRIADVTAFAHPPALAGDVGDLIICCNMTRRGPADTFVEAPDLLAELIAMRLFEPGAQLLDSHIEPYPTPLRKAFESTDAVRVISTYDLGIELERHADRWMSIG